MKQLRVIPILLVLLMVISSCERVEVSTEITLDPRLLNSSVLKLREYSLQQNSLAIAEAELLEAATRTFLQLPTNENQVVLQTTWLHAHTRYLDSQFSLLKGIVSSSPLNFCIESWPIQAGFLDNIPLYPNSGIVNDITLSINSEVLRQQHGITDIEEVSLGYHALEYFIFQRDSADFLDANITGLDTGQQIVNAQMRRRQILKIIASELVKDLKSSPTLINTQFTVDESAGARQRLSNFIHSTAIYLESMQRESSLLIDKNSGHGHYSQSTFTNLETSLAALASFTLDEVNLMPIFLELDTITATNYEKTVRDASALVKDPEAGELEFAKLPLMMSALLHQLEHFELRLDQH